MTSGYAPLLAPGGALPLARSAATLPSGRFRRFFQTPGWPLTVALMGFPIFWVLGLGEFDFPIMAVPMVIELRRSHRPVRVPAYFGVWLALLLWVIAGGLLVGQHLPGTLPGSGGFIGWFLRVVNLLAATAFLLYVGNLTEAEMPVRKVIRMLSFLFLVTVAGGLLGVLLGNVQFTSAFELILPQGIRSNFYVHQLVHPGFAQVEDVLGHTSPRPKAPFAYTNTWGNNLSLLMVWFVVGWWVHGTHRRKVAAAIVLLAAAVPIVYSLNRGVWIGIGLCLLFLIFHLTARGKFGLLVAALTLAGIGGLVFALTPLHTIVTERLQHPHSNNIRTSLNDDALAAALKSPIVGWGTTRSALGSPSSIAIGKTPSCPTCGNAPIGSTGEIWTLFIANGFVGAGLFVGFLLLSAFRYRRDRSPEAVAMRLILYIAPFYALFYPALPTALSVTFISLALIWRRHAPEPVALGKISLG